MRNIRPIALLLGILAYVLACCTLPPEETEEEEAGRPTGNDPSAGLTWLGETDKFSITPEEGIRLYDLSGEAGTAYVSTPSSHIYGTTWEFTARLTFKSSTNNYARFYLTSTSRNPGTADGYYLQLGGKQQQVSFCKQKDGEETTLALLRPLPSSQEVNYRIECTPGGEWIIHSQQETDNGFAEETSQLHDTSIRESAYASIRCVYTSSRAKNFYFSGIKIGHYADSDLPPEEAGEPEQPEEPEERPDPTPTVTLTFNEVMYDPKEGGVEYVELYNPSPASLLLYDLVLEKRTLDDSPIRGGSVHLYQNKDKPLKVSPHGYICFSKDSQTLVDIHQAPASNLVEMKLPSLSNQGGYLVLRNADGEETDRCLFHYSLHTVGTQKETKGKSLEKTDPLLPSDDPYSWRTSNDGSGGTPGKANS